MNYEGKNKLIEICKRMYVGYTIMPSDLHEMNEIIKTLEDEDAENVNEFVKNAIAAYAASNYCHNRIQQLDKKVIAEKLCCSLATVYNKIKNNSFTIEELEMLERIENE